MSDDAKTSSAAPTEPLAMLYESQCTHEYQDGRSAIVPLLKGRKDGEKTCMICQDVFDGN